ncbi:hypothetical protein [Alteromonas stellipolaris]|jgi:hypothetical protein|uniref:hypothetical protein n=1 Tax=Alteromonas stellipolaris TaxID=233316 RepID=UPI0026E41CE1|nr:hypothetical protein [Alteromonas stellipolaris]MDO6536042.1 hypothetical protein [Alteromonas stellipolaris]MDO6627950.1 hypothetical protein [Alteromonas stellipolaris]
MADFDISTSGKSDCAIFTFGSYTNPGRTEPSYAFVNTILRLKKLGKIDIDVYYFKAKKNDWYLSGLSGERDFCSSIEFLNKLKSKYSKIACAGNSMGGYAALAFGSLIQATKVEAFSPQTRFDNHFLSEIGEYRWKESLFNLAESVTDIGDYSIKSIIESNVEKSDCTIYYGEKCKQDSRYALELVNLENVTLNKQQELDHDLVTNFRNSGKLDEVITGIFQN